MATSQAVDGLTAHGAFSRWNPLWGMLGIGLPLTFAGQVRPATMFLRTSELVPLYATEWIIFGVIGLIAAGILAVFDVIAVKSRLRVDPAAASKVGFAIVVATSVLLGFLTWVAALRHGSPLVNSWQYILIAVVVPVGIAVACGLFQDTLVEITTIARFLAFAGSTTLLSLPFPVGTAAARDEHRVAIAQTASRPNIVLITVDALAASHLLPYGSLRRTSPNIAAFASQAIVFDQFHANSNFTTPAVASILTGVLPWSHRALQLQSHPNDNSVVDSLPARLHEGGYLTAYFGSNPWAGARRLGFSDYFDYQDSDLDWTFGPCFDSLAAQSQYLCPAAANLLIAISYATAVRMASALGLVRLDPHSDLEQLVARARRWTEGHGQSPVFMWVHIFPPHDPYAAPQPWLGQFDQTPVARSAHDSRPVPQFGSLSEPASRISTLAARYDENVAYMDHYMGQLFLAIHQNLGPNTAILLTSDHGESFDHGYGSHAGPMLYEDLIHIPLIVALPGAFAPTERRNELATQIDIPPTIAAIAGVAPSSGWHGRSLLAPSKDSEPRTIFSMNFEQNRNREHLTTGVVAALRSNWKLVRFFGDLRYANMPAPQTQLFDLASDSHEHENLATVHPDIVAALSAEIDGQLSVHGGAINE